jgi:hypothetical protein
MIQILTTVPLADNFGYRLPALTTDLQTASQLLKIQLWNDKIIVEDPDNSLGDLKWFTRVSLYRK